MGALLGLPHGGGRAASPGRPVKAVGADPLRSCMDAGLTTRSAAGLPLAAPHAATDAATGPPPASVSFRFRSGVLNLTAHSVAWGLAGGPAGPESLHF